MTTDDRVAMMEAELHQIKDELVQLMLDIRAFILEARNPLRPFERPATPDEGPEKGVEENGRAQES